MRMTFLFALLLASAAQSAEKRRPSSDERWARGAGELLATPKQVAAIKASGSLKNTKTEVFKFALISAAGVAARTYGVVSGVLDSGAEVNLIVGMACAETAVAALENKALRFTVMGNFEQSDAPEWKQVSWPQSEYCVLAPAP